MTQSYFKLLTHCACSSTIHAIHWINVCVRHWHKIFETKSIQSDSHQKSAYKSWVVHSQWSTGIGCMYFVDFYKLDWHFACRQNKIYAHILLFTNFIHTFHILFRYQPMESKTDFWSWAEKIDLPLFCLEAFHVMYLFSLPSASCPRSYSVLHACWQ